ncbi:sulfide/dihydroorotate dehydrogenase-like FAD/NAD-binding protein [Coprococcus sp. CLA-AA-H212]|jgi:ferredoxin--NADP+ reductase|uniref:Sulfide/dihydroorotate dehydrogenase-like FAD/NAD-binding protein n=1 Tax=Coprococcus hominis (ex Arizal et al. 2022) TaxID=2881262 RepID=A0ABS8FL77_9FIRM|nr:sulfide/dihydroorotate dehydrogenase-like FAD/NAD-binding protein [Coprococcus hominis (ex Arizal et al. 2022)]MCC2217931.1 sulfide/dihydroorotate dehydrogenase-like FAD/NAD-binding protein [Coprococcus hominis (ex Arizal et al. 2022)]
MYKIVKKEVLNSVVVMMEIEAPYVAARCEAGQFVIVRVDEDGERIPLTIADFDRERNTVEIIFQVVGYSTTLMAKLNEGDYLQDFVGPLGQPAPLNKEWKRVIGIAGGVGAAPLYPQAKKLAEQGTKVDVIIGGRTAELVLLKEKFEKFCDNVYIMTDDGSLGEQGVVTKKLQELLDAGVQYDHAIAIGPLIMMKFVVALTKKPEYNLPTAVSLNPIMIDGTGMCGGCRVTVGGETKFACVDGPDFDGFEVDFDQCMKRQTFFKEEEHACMMKLQADQMQN